MALFVTNASVTLPRGVYAIDTPTPAVVQPTGTDVTVMVGQLPWGPSEVLTYGDIGNLLQQFAPAGMTRTGSAYLSLIRKAWPSPGVVRVADASAVKASVVISSSAPAALFTVTAIATGSQGNSIVVTIGPSGDGNVAHFRMTVQVSSASGTTSEVYDNIDPTNATTLANTVNVTSSVLIGPLTWTANGTPVQGNSTMSGGTDGTVTSTMYVGTPGTDNLGFALLESDDTISHVFTDDPGNSLRAAVNAGLLAHVQLTTDRVGYINGNSGQSASSAQSDVANYRAIQIVYCDPWANIFDDTTGAMRLVPSSSFAASVAAQLPPSTSIAWRADAVSGLLDGIVQLEFNRSAVRAQNTASGISTLIQRKRGGFTFEAGVNTSLTPGLTNLTRTRMVQFLAKSTVDSWETYVEGPNIPAFQQDLINSENTFLAQLKANSQSVNAAFQPYIIDYLILPIGAANTTAFIQSGNFAVNTQVELGANMSRIYLQQQAGETVVINAQ